MNTYWVTEGAEFESRMSGKKVNELSPLLCQNIHSISFPLSYTKHALQKFYFFHLTPSNFQRYISIQYIYILIVVRFLLQLASSHH